jgi:hypothetical protein
MFVIIQFHCKYRIPKGQSKMDNPEKLATQFNTMLVITRRRKTGQKHNIMCVNLHNQHFVKVTGHNCYGRKFFCDFEYYFTSTTECM